MTVPFPGNKYSGIDTLWTPHRHLWPFAPIYWQRKASLALDCVINHRPTFMWEYSNLTNNEYEGLSQSADSQLPPQHLTSLNIIAWPVMSATANHQPQGHPTVFSAEAVLLQLVTGAVLSRPASHCKRCWNQCGRCSLGAQHWHHLKAVCSAPKAFSEKFTVPCIIPET